MNNWWWVQYLCGMAVMCSRKNTHLDHVFCTGIPTVFERNVFIRKSRYFNIFSVCTSLTALLLSHPQLSWDLHNWMMKPHFLQNMLQRLWPCILTFPCPESCSWMLVVPNASDSPWLGHVCQWSGKFRVQLYIYIYKNSLDSFSPGQGFIITIPGAC